MYQRIQAALLFLFTTITINGLAQPVITTQPASTNMCAGQKLDLSVEAYGIEPFAWEWRFNGTPIENGIDQVFTLPIVIPAHSGTYTVVVTDPGGSVTSAPAILVVNPLPNVTVNSGVICGSCSVMLTATTDAANPTYLWSPGGETTASITVSPTSTTTYSVTVTDGATGCSGSGSGTVTVSPVPNVAVNSATICAGGTATLTATSDAANPSYLWTPGNLTGQTIMVSPSSTTTYTVTVTDGTTSCPGSASGTVTVNAATTATGPSNQTVNQGQNATFTTVAGGTGPFTFTWRKGATLLDGPGANSSYTVVSAQPADQGTYSVEVQGSCGSVTNSATLTVIVPPAITQDPQGLTRTNGGSATFTVSATGSALAYQWRVNGFNISGANASTLTLPSVSPGQGGNYDVVVSNAAGTATSAAATLTVLVPAGIDSQPVSLVRTQGLSATFTVVATGDNPISYQWRFNGGNIAGANGSSYTIPIVQLSDAGGYSVVVSNNSGSTVSSTATLTVLTPRSAIYVDFNTVGDLTNNFGGRLFNSGNAATWVETNSGGVLNSRAIGVGRSNNDGQTLTYLGESFDFTQIGTVLNIAVSVKAKTATQTGYPSVQLGFLNETNAYFSGDNPAIFMSARLGCQTTPSTWQLEQQTKLAGVGAASGNGVTGGATTVGNWYRVKATFTKTAATQYTVTASLQDMGTDGNTPGSTVLVLNSGNPITVTNPDITSDGTVWPAFRYSDQRGIEAMDNFAAWGSSGAVSFTQQPADQSIEANRTATFVAKVDGLGPYTFQWFRDGNAIAGANTRIYSLTATTSDNGAQLSVRATNSLGFAVSSNATLTVIADTTAPTVVSAGSLNGSKVGIAFSEKVSPATATVPGNYAVSGGVVSSVVLRPDGKSVELTLSTPTTGNFTVTVSGVQDLAGNPVSASANSASGNVAGLTAFDVNGTDGVAPLSAGSTFTAKDNEFDVTAGGADLWNTADDGQLVVGPRTGDFDFRVRVQSITRPDYMSVTGSRGDFAKATITARASTAANAAVVQVALFPELVGLPSGRNYWEHSFRPSGGTEAGIPGANNYVNAWTGGALNYYTTPRANPVNWGRLRRYNDTFTYYVSSNGVDWIQTAQMYQPMGNTLQVGLGMTAHFDAANYRATAEFRNLSDVSFPGTITVTAINPSSTNVPAFSPATFTVSASGSGIPASELQYQWQRSDGLGGFTNVPGAPMTASYTTPVLLESDSGSQWRAIVKSSGAAGVTSPAASVTVFDTTAPTIVSASIPTGSVQHVFITFSEPVASGSADVAANYTITNSSGVSIPVTSAAFAVDTKTILLGTASPLAAGLYGVVVNNVRDRATTPNTIAANSAKSFTVAVTTGNPALVELFTGISGTAVANLTSDPKYLNQTPDTVTYTNIFAWMQNLPSPGFADNYGTRITSYFVAPSNGVYRFFIRSDDLSQLSMNTNSVNSTDRAGAVIIAQQNTACCKNYGDTSGGPNTSVNIPLVAGQRYYLEALHKEGGGGDGFTMTFREQNVTGSPANTEVTTAQFLELPTGPMAIASITPSSLTVPENSVITFKVAGITGAGPTKYQWFKNGSMIPGAIGFSYTTPPLSINDTTFSFAASNLFSSAQISANLTIIPDTVAPTILSVLSSPTLTNVTVAFSERPTQATAENTANYQIAGLTIVSATLLADGTNVVLRTSPQTEGQAYTLVVNNVQDRAGAPNTIAPNTSITFGGAFAAGLVKLELFVNIGGTAVSSLTTSTKYLNNTPDLVYYTNGFAFGNPAVNSFLTLANSTLDNYGTRISGWFVAPSNGVYRFYIRSDDLSQLSMNTNAVDGTDPRGAVIIAQQSTACCKPYGDTSGGPNTSGNITLLGGRKYYIEALHKEGTGGDGFAMTWREVSTATNVPPNNEIAPSANFVSFANLFLPGAPVISITQQPVNAPDTLENRTATFTVAANNSANTAMGIQWQKNGVDIPGASGPSYTTPLLTLGDASTYSAKIVVPGAGAAAFSTAAGVNILADMEGPSVLAAFGDPISNHVRVVFSERINADLSSLAPGNYYFSGGQLVTNVELLADGRTAILSLDNAIVPSSGYFVDVAGASDLAGNSIISGTSPAFTAPWIATNGVLLRERFFGNSGVNSFQTMSNNPAFPNSPSVSDYVTSANSPQSAPNIDNYTTRLTGFIIPPVSGNYNFRVHSDDSGWVLLSPDAEAANRQTVPGLRDEGDCGACGNATWGIPGNTLGPIPLKAGNAYYIEALTQEGTGGDLIEVSWIVPGTGVTNIIPAANIAYAANPDAVSLQITLQPTNLTVQERRVATFVAAANGTGPIAYQWQSFDFNSFAWVDIVGATNSSYSITPTDSATQSGMLFRLTASLGGGLVDRTATSDEVTLTVEDDTTGPVALRTYSLGGSTIKIVFDEDLDLFGATDGPSYSVPGATVLRVDLQADSAGISNTVLLWLDRTLPGPGYSVSGAIPDGGGNYAAFSLNGGIFASGSGLVDDGPVGSATDPLEKGSTSADPNRLEVVSGGSDIWNNADGFRYVYGLYTNDFDVKVRVSRLDERNRWSKAGLVVREDLTAGSHDLSAVVTPSAVAALDGSGVTANDYEAGSRAAAGAATTDWGQFRPTPVPYPNAWIRLRRSGDTFTAFWASDGLSWTQFASTNQSFPATVYLGLGTTAHNNGAGQVTTAVYQDFGLILPPTITVPPQSQSVVAGTSATFGVTVSGEAPFTYQWRFNGAAIPGETGATLTINNVQAGNVGSYDVVVSNIAGSATSAAASLTLAVPPTITTPPGNQSVACHGTAMFSVFAEGDGPLSYQWYYNNSILTGETGATLTLANVTPGSDGFYKVIVSNPAGSVTSGDARLTVVDTVPPSLTCPANIAVCTSSNSAVVTFSTPSASDNCDASVLVAASPASGSEFPLGNTTVTVTATDGSGNATTCTFTITVTKATAPTLTVVDYGGGTFRFSFPSQNNCVYLLQYKNSLDETEWTTLRTVTGNGSVLTADDTSAGGTMRFYQVKVQ